MSLGRDSAATCGVMVTLLFVQNGWLSGKGSFFEGKKLIRNSIWLLTFNLSIFYLLDYLKKSKILFQILPVSNTSRTASRIQFFSKASSNSFSFITLLLPILISTVPYSFPSRWSENNYNHFIVFYPVDFRNRINSTYYSDTITFTIFKISFSKYVVSMGRFR